ncbi:MAG: hypothetical protein KJ990_12515 [Proteobacteria bacterium]|nr:hypothetical protein [Pseudomonadota bacterium]MBU1648239.1 hypothetical protein [Pseudomonadota bacterium]
MKAEISAIKAVLQAGLSGIKSRDIYVTEDIRLIRATGGYPAIGIKDGTTNFDTEVSDQVEVVQTVTLAVYVQLFKPEAGIMGDTIQKGVLELAADIIVLLRNNDLGGLADSSLPLSIGASELLTDGNLVIQMAPVVMQYTKYDDL